MSEKNPAAVALVKLSMAKRTPDERVELERQRKAGYKKLPPAERSAVARKS